MAAVTFNTSGVSSNPANYSTGSLPAAVDTLTVPFGVRFENDLYCATPFCTTFILNGDYAPSTTVTNRMYVGDGVVTTPFQVGNQARLLLGSKTYSAVSAQIPASITAGILLKLAANGNQGISFAISGANYGRLEMWGDGAYHSVTQTLPKPWEGTGATGVSGTYSSWTTGTYAAAATSFVLATDLGLQAGDRITISQGNTTNGDSASTHYQEMVVASYNSGTKTVTTTTGLSQAKTERFLVQQMTRNVYIASDDPAKGFAMAVTIFGSTNYLGQVWEHGELRYHGNLNSTNNTASWWSGMKQFGCSFTAATPSTPNANNQLYRGFLYNNTYYRVVLGSLVSTDTGISGAANILNVSAIGSFLGQCVNAYIKDSIFTNTSSVMANQIGVIIENCIFKHVRFLGSSNVGSEYISCVADRVNQPLDSSSANTIKALSVYQSGGLDNLAYNNNYKTTFIGGTSLPSAAIFFSNTSGQAYYVATVAEDGTSNGTRQVQTCGTMTRYTSGTVPDTGVFPLPSGAIYANKLVPLSNINLKPVRYYYRIPLTAGQTFTFTLPVMLRGTSGGFPTAEENFLSVTFPSGTAQVTTTVPTAHDAWTLYSITATAASTGILQAYFNIGKYYSAGGVYVDFPLNVSSAGYAWVLGQMNEDYVPYGSGLAFDVAAEVVNKGNMLADMYHRRNNPNIEASSVGDPLSLKSSYGMNAQGTHHTYENEDGTILTITKSDGVTVLGTRTITKRSDSDPITGLETN